MDLLWLQPAQVLRDVDEMGRPLEQVVASLGWPQLRHDRGKGIPLCFRVKGMRGKGRGLEVHTPAYPCTLTKGLGVCRGMAYIRISCGFSRYRGSYL